jgi:hypothetical protein
MDIGSIKNGWRYSPGEGNVQRSSLGGPKGDLRLAKHIRDEPMRDNHAL